MFRGSNPRRLAAQVSKLLAALVLALWFAAPAAAVQRTQFDHLTTGYELRGFHRDLACEYCHLQGVFKGTPRTCVGCHRQNNPDLQENDLIAVIKITVPTQSIEMP